MLHNVYSNHFFKVPTVRVPYHGDIPHGLVPGKQIYIRGTVPHHASRFIVDLETNSGIAFHFNPRFDQNCVVRNSMSHGSYAHEERGGPMPFHRGHNFEIIILVEHDKYKVAVNGVHSFEFNHRASFHEVTHLAITGDVELNKIVFSGDANPTANEVHNPHVPFAIPLHGIAPGKLIQIRGNVLHHTNRFVVNLQNGSAVNSDAHDIALHFSVRFDDPYSGTAVVVTNKHHGNWGGEDRPTEPFPFAKGAPFEILIMLDHGQWKVAVNGRHFHAFNHRNPFFDANHIEIDGDVAITSIREY